MNTYCLKCRTSNADIDPKMVKTKNNRLLMQSKCGTKKARFVKEQDAKGLLRQLGIKTPLSKIPLLNVLFYVYKMDEIINKFLLVGDKFMPEMHLRQKNKERIDKFLQTGNSDFIYKNELDKACFQHDMAYGKSKDLVKRTQSDKV